MVPSDVVDFTTVDVAYLGENKKIIIIIHTT